METFRDQFIEFNKKHVAHSKARLVDRNRHIVDVSSMGFSMQDRLELVRMSEASEQKLGESRITDWLSPGFFDTNFWHMWQTTFAFQPWHSAVELKRYLHRFMNEFPRIETLAGVKRTIYNQYDSLVRPLETWLEARDVRFMRGCTVDDLVLEADGDQIAVTGIAWTRSGTRETVAVGPNDLVFFQNGSMTDASSFGSMINTFPSSPPERKPCASASGCKDSETPE